MAHLPFHPKYTHKKKLFQAQGRENQVPCGATEAKEIAAKLKGRENKHIICLSLDVALFLLRCPGSTAF